MICRVAPEALRLRSAEIACAVNSRGKIDAGTRRIRFHAHTDGCLRIQMRKQALAQAVACLHPSQRGAWPYDGPEQVQRWPLPPRIWVGLRIARLFPVTPRRTMRTPALGLKAKYVRPDIKFQRAGLPAGSGARRRLDIRPFSETMRPMMPAEGAIDFLSRCGDLQLFGRRNDMHRSSQGGSKPCGRAIN